MIDKDAVYATIRLLRDRAVYKVVLVDDRALLIDAANFLEELIRDKLDKECTNADRTNKVTWHGKPCHKCGSIDCTCNLY
uniref:Uncharacterized protein n=1 Tax=viral metagenome TaxID=1070528 RepID=A0A6M3LK66_9ZZZZ